MQNPHNAPSEIYMSMTATKNCPSCYETIPEMATRCKHCFEDLRLKPKSPFQFPVFMPIAFLAVSLLVYFWADYISTSLAFNKHVFDHETKSIVQISKTGDGIKAKRISFEDISTFEYVIGGEYARYEIVAITRSSDRIIVQSSADPLKRDVELLSESIGSNFTTVNNTRGNLE